MDSMYTQWTCEMCIGYPGRFSDDQALLSQSVLSLSEEDAHSESENIPVASPLKHSRYYFDDGNVTLSVEGTLYKIHWYLLERYSSPISSMFSAPHDSPDDAPIVLAVAAKDFDSFVSILYPVDCGVFTATVDEWTSILVLAVQWNFQSIRTLAINRLSAVTTPVDKIVLGRGHDIFEWLENAYATVCWRDEPLTIEEGKRLGVEDVIKIAAVRQGNNTSDFIPGSQTSAFRKTFGLRDSVSTSNSGVEKDKHERLVVWSAPVKSIRKKRKGKNRREFLYMTRTSYDGL